MDLSDIFAQLPAQLFSGILHGFAIFGSAALQSWQQHPIIGTLFVAAVVTSVVLRLRRGRRRRA